MKKMSIFALITIVFTCVQGHAIDLVNPHLSHLPPGGRKSLHGMVLFGSVRYFLEHIPMLSPPHDFQIIAEVRLLDRSGVAITGDFSNSGFTLKPSENFSLNDYISGRLRKFSGSVHRGSFEQGGPIVAGLESVNIEVIGYKLVRQLPAESKLSVFEISDGTSIFESNIIRPNQSLQTIRNKTKDIQLWCVVGPDFFDPCPDKSVSID